MECNGTGSSPKQQGQVESEIATLGAVIDSTQSIRHRLEERLMGVLLDPLPQNDSAKSVVDEAVVPIAGNIRQKRISLSEINRDIESILERIQL